MSSLHITPTIHPARLAKGLFKLERRGQYKAALSEIEPFWSDLQLAPDIMQFEVSDAAEVLLRCGSLLGFYGHNEQIENSQILSRNLLTDARERFSDINEAEKIAECENYLALAYWRTGEFNEAEACVGAALEHDLLISSDTRLYSHAIVSLLNLACKRHTENADHAERFEDNFRQYASDYLRGIFYSNVGLSYKNLGYVSKALSYLELAKHHYHLSGHKIYLGTAENNLAQLYKENRYFIKAHDAIDQATQVFRKLKDKTREGFSLDTKAQIYFAESKYSDALKAIETGISLLRKSENTAYLIEALLTKAKILLYLDNFSEAVFELSDGVTLARIHDGDKAAMRLISEFEAALEAKNTPIQLDIDSDELELILPGSLANYSEYKGVWINTPHLENIGIISGSLAIVVPSKVDRGDLVALSEVENGAVSCGFYDSEFGIICLERGDDDPLLFDQDDIKILGKIVGVCSSGKDADGKMTVEALKL